MQTTRQAPMIAAARGSLTATQAATAHPRCCELTRQAWVDADAKRRFVRNALVLFLALSLAAGRVPAELVVNGGFEAPHITSGRFTLYSMPGWIVGPQGVEVCAPDGMVAHEGQQSLQLHGTNAGTFIQQTFATVLGQLYRLSFPYANNPDSDLATFNVSVVGSTTLVDQTLTHSGSTRAAMNYRFFESNFAADSTQTTLRFTRISTNWGQAPVVDAVSVTQVVVNPRPSSWIPFEEHAITDFGDAPKSLLAGNVQLVSDAFPSVISSNTPAYFSGSSSFIELQGSSGMNLLPLTISLWVKAPGQYGSDTGLVTKYGIASVNGFGLFAFGDHVHAWYFGASGSVYSAAGSFSSGSILNGNWHHVVVVFDNSGGRLYVDGVLKSSQPWAGSPSTCTTTIPVLLGEYRASDMSERRMMYNGLMDDVRILNASLSTEQIQAQYNAQLQGRYDTDGDGFVDAVEFASNSNPNDAASVPDLHRVCVEWPLPVGAQIVRRGEATVTIQTAFTNGTILYTLDGSEPSLASDLYTEPLTLRQSCILRAKAYDATFSQQIQSSPIEVVILPTLAATPAGGGSVAIAPPDGAYFSNSMASITATPAPGWTFLQWLGDASGSNPVASIQMTRDKQVQAVFGTTVGTAMVGSGTIAQTPVAPFYPYGSQVRFSALPNAGQYLSFWGNAVSSTDNPLTFVVTNANPTVTAVFQPLGVNQFALALVAVGKGMVTASPVANRYGTGESVTLTAAPDAGQNFIGWSGDASGTNNPLGVTMNQSKTITANFTKRPSLRVSTPLEGLVEDGFRLTLFGEFGTPYAILGSTNLHDWQVAGAVTNAYGTVQFVDPDGTNSPQKFYRATEP